MRELLHGLEEARASGKAEGGVEALVERLARAQQEQVEILDQAHDRVSAQGDIIYKAEAELSVALRQRTVDGETVERLFAKYKVDAGDGLSSDTVREIEKRGGKVYPEPYRVKRSGWALVERRSW